MVHPLGGTVGYFVGGPLFVVESVQLVEVGGVPEAVGHEGAEGVPQLAVGHVGAGGVPDWFVGPEIQQ